MIRSGFIAPAGADAWIGVPPSADPSGVVASLYGDELEGLKVRVQWVNGDENAFTQVGFSTDALTEPATVWSTAGPGVTLMDTGKVTTGGDYAWVRHTRGGSPGDWVGGVTP